VLLAKFEKGKKQDFLQNTGQFTPNGYRTRAL